MLLLNAMFGASDFVNYITDGSGMINTKYICYLHTI